MIAPRLLDSRTPRALLAVALALATLVPLPGRAGTADAPDRTYSGRVFASLDPDLPPAYGPNPAKVVVLVFSDFQCPVSRRVTDATHQIAEEFPGSVRVEFRQLPLVTHPQAEDAAVAALAAHRQSAFWPMHDVLFANQADLGADRLPAHARQVGLDVERWRQDAADPALRARVRLEKDLADRLGAGATPSFLVNGALTVGWASWLSFRHDVAQELRAVEALLASGTPLADVHLQRARANLKDAAAFEAYRSLVVAPLAGSATTN